MKQLSKYMIGLVLIALLIAFAGCESPTSSDDSEDNDGGSSKSDSELIMGFWVREINSDETANFTSSTSVYYHSPESISGEFNYSLDESTNKLTWSGTATLNGKTSSFEIIYSYSISATQLVLTLESVDPTEWSTELASRCTFIKND